MKLNIDLKYVINSNVNFAKHSLKILIPSMLDCGIEHKNILVILGGSDDNSVKFINTGMFMCLNVKMNAIDQTSFYTIKKNCHLFPKHIYYIHDTTKAGPDFKTNIEKYYEVFKKNNLKTLKNTKFYSSNMGFYDRDFIINTLNSKKCYSENESIYTDEINPNNPDNLKLKKDVGFKLEDAIFAQDLEENNMGWAISDTMAQFSDKVDIYNTQNERTVAYYDKLDLYKYYGNTFISKDNKLNNNLNCKI